MQKKGTHSRHRTRDGYHLKAHQVIFPPLKKSPVFPFRGCRAFGLFILSMATEQPNEQTTLSLQQIFHIIETYQGTIVKSRNI